MVHRVALDIADDWKLHHDNVLAHIVFLHDSYPSRFKSVNGSPIILQFYVTSSDFFFFLRLKALMKRHNFGIVDKVKRFVAKL